MKSVVMSACSVLSGLILVGLLLNVELYSWACLYTWMF
jgi:hypothetical protein